MKFKVQIYCLVALVVVGALLLIHSKKFQTAQPLTSTSIRLKWTHQAQFAGIYVAQDKGLYRDANLLVTILERSVGNKLGVREVVNGDIDFAIVSSLDFLTALNNHQPVQAVAAFYQYSPSVLVSKASSNIHSPSDLVGRRLGVFRNNEQSRLLYEALFAATGVTTDLNQYHEVGFNYLDALLHGTVDVVPYYRVNMHELDAAGIDYNILLPERYGVDMYNDILITSKSTYRDRLPLVQRFVRSTIEGWNYAFSHQAEAVEMTLKRMPREQRNPQTQAYVLKASEPLMRSKSDGSIGTMTPLQWDASYDLFHKHGLIGDFEVQQSFAPPYVFQ